MHTHIYIYTLFFYTTIQYTHAYSQTEFIPVMILFMENLISKSITGRMTCARPTSSSASSTPAVAMMCRRLAMKTFITVHQKCDTEWHITYIHACTHTHARMHMYISNYTFIIIVTYAYIYYIILYYLILYYILLYYIIYIYVGCDRAWSSSLQLFFYGFRCQDSSPRACSPSSFFLKSCRSWSWEMGTDRSWPSRDG